MAKRLRILSWNVNGIRAIHKKGFVEWFAKERPDILCLQETKASEEQVPEEILSVAGYKHYFSSAERKGYSGVCIFSRTEPKDVKNGFGISEFDNEGRILIADYGKFILLNLYCPNGKASKERLKYKMQFYDALLGRCTALRKRKKRLVLTGDFNTAHKEIDLARPKANETTSGFLPEERAWIDQFLGQGFIDTYRMFDESPGKYTWWDYKTRARERNIGWRIDYFFAGDDLKKNVKSAFILDEVMGSDHCPVGIELSLPVR